MFRTHLKPLTFVATLFLLGCLSGEASARPDRAYPKPPDWVRDQTVYEVNIRQFSETGNVAGLRKQLPRLKALGIGTLWIMPVNTIGVEGRAGTLGSPYAVQDYSAFNPEFGTLDEFKAMVAEAHGMGMHVILDWVANHSSLDNVWAKQHPDWYKRDAGGALVHPMAEWKDVAALNYEKPELRKAMIAAMSMWVRDAGIDGFRCDTAEWVPLDFWSDARDALRAIKPVLMLAEGNKPELMNYAFDSAYAWNFLPNATGIVAGGKNATDLRNFIEAEQRVVPEDGFRLWFTSNHDKNSWEGTTKEQLADAAPAFAVLTFTLPGMPMIYNGQEAGDAEHRLQFFEHDPIVWREDPMAKFYAALAKLKRENKALWADGKSAPVQFIAGGTNDSVLTFAREAKGDRVIVMVNLSAQVATAPAPAGVETMHSVFAADAAPATNASISLKPWAYRVWTNAK